jgi:hypothetical protein
MPSSYSNLKFELIANGEQAGTWGSTTNANIGTAIEEAITGSANITFNSADVTLTLDNTSSSQVARNLRLNLVGTSGGARNLILGSGCQINKQYIVRNNLAHAVTVRNTSGTGITVGAGKTKLLFNDGTNVTDASPDTDFVAVTSVGAVSPLASSGGTTPSISLTGIVGAANGGTGRNTLTSGALIIGNGTGQVNQLAGSTVGQIPQWNGSTWTATQVLVSPELTTTIYSNGSYRANAVAVSALDINMSLGNYFTKSISANSTFTFSNTPSSRAFSFTLRLTVSGSRTVTWPSSVRWPNNSAPSLTADRTHLFMFATDNGGSTWRGAALTNYTA